MREWLDANHQRVLVQRLAAYTNTTSTGSEVLSAKKGDQLSLET